MFDVKISKEYLVDTDGTSDGTQLKYRYNGYWYKEDCEECEGVVEELVSNFLKCTSLKESEYVVYERGYINGKRGCRSKDFLGDDESFVTLARLYKNISGNELQEVINKMENFEEKILFVLNFVKQTTRLDLTEYFKKVFTLDYVALNEDRHFYNMGIIYNENGSYKPAPIFDNGKSLLNGNPSKNQKLSVVENVNRVTAKPFCGSHEKHYEYFGKGFTIDFDKVQNWLKNEENTHYRDVLIYQISKIKKDKTFA